MATNLLARDFTASAPDQRWVGDTTELLTLTGKLYLAVIIDLFSRFVVGWALSAVTSGFGASWASRPLDDVLLLLFSMAYDLVAPTAISEWF